MLRLLLDEHIWPKLADQLRAALPAAQIESLERTEEQRNNELEKEARSPSG